MLELPNELEHYIEINKKDFVVFKTSLLVKEAGDDVSKRAEMIKEVLESVALIPPRRPSPTNTTDACPTKG